MAFVDTLRARLDSLHAERASLVAELDTITQAAETEQRAALNDTEEAAYAAAVERVRAIDAETDTVKARVAELDDVAARAQRAAEVQRRAPVPGMAPGHDEIDPSSRFVSRSELRSRAADLTASRATPYARDAHRQSVTELLDRGDQVSEIAARLVLATSNETYMRAWFKAMSGQPLLNEEAVAISRAMEIRAMVEGTAASGGYSVPTPIDPTMIITGAGSTNPFRRVSRRITLSEGYVWKGVSAAQITASWDAEQAEVSDDSPTLSQPAITAFMARVFVPYSIEAGQDIPGLVGDIAMLMADAKDNLEAAAHATGTGTGQPWGVVSAVGAVTASRVSATTGSTYGLVDIYKVANALPARHREASGTVAWAMHNSTINSTRQFGTSSNYHGYLVDLGAGQPARLLGAPLLESSSITSTVTTGNDLMIYGDFSKYQIVDKLGMTTEYIPHMFHTTTNLPSLTRGIIAYWRTGAGVLDADAFRTLRL